MRLCSILSACAINAALATLGTAQAQTKGFTDNVINLGVLTDMSGVYSDFAGKGSVTAVEMAVEDFGGAVKGVPVKVVYADHLNKADVGASIAREWYDVGKVDAIFDTSNSAVSLAVMGITREKNRIVVVGGSSTTRITTDSCTPNSIQYVYDSNALSNVTAKALISQGAKSWYFLTVDFAFGHGLEKTTSDVVKAAGGKVLGAVRHPLNAADFSSYIVQAQASGAQVIALANGGSDTVNAIKSANEFGAGTGSQRVASLLTFITDVHSMGLAQAKDIMLTEAFYWDLNDETRKWSRRFFERNKRMPTMVQAGMYSATTHYLKALAAAGTDNATAAMAKMKSTPVNDFFAKNGKIRADGLHVHDMYLMQVKQPKESKYAWDYYKVKSVVPGSEAFSPMSPACSLSQ
jgi:branched-chain amino acid transport system substrate-binding protein